MLEMNLHNNWVIFLNIVLLYAGNSSEVDSLASFVFLHCCQLR